MVKSERTSYLTMVSYRLFGKIIPRFTFLRNIYLKSGIYRLYESYIALMFFITTLVFVSVFTASAVLHRIFYDLPLLQYFTVVFILSSISALLVPILFITYPLYRSGQKKKEIDSNLVYTTGYMGVLSAGDISVERIFERISQVEQHPAIKDLAKRFMFNVKVFGFDVVSSLEDITRRSPSQVFSRLLAGITNTVKTSGDLKSLLAYETKRLLHTKREELKKTLNSLMTFGEIYISAMVMGPIVFIIMLTILSIMGNTSFGLSTIEQLNLLVFFGLPTLSLIFIVILNGMLPEEE